MAKFLLPIQKLKKKNLQQLTLYKLRHYYYTGCMWTQILINNQKFRKQKKILVCVLCKAFVTAIKPRLRVKRALRKPVTSLDQTWYIRFDTSYYVKKILDILNIIINFFKTCYKRGANLSSHMCRNNI